MRHLRYSLMLNNTLVNQEKREAYDKVLPPDLRGWSDPKDSGPASSSKVATSEKSKASRTFGRFGVLNDEKTPTLAKEHQATISEKVRKAMEEKKESAKSSPEGKEDEVTAEEEAPRAWLPPDQVDEDEGTSGIGQALKGMFSKLKNKK